MACHRGFSAEVGKGQNDVEQANRGDTAPAADGRFGCLLELAAGVRRSIQALMPLQGVGHEMMIESMQLFNQGLPGGLRGHLASGSLHHQRECSAMAHEDAISQTQQLGHSPSRIPQPAVVGGVMAMAN